MVGGRDSSAAAIIALAGGVNAAEAIEGFKPMSDEAIIAAAPDVDPDDAQRRRATRMTSETLFAMPAFAQTPAAARKAPDRHGRALSARLRPAHARRRRAI